MMYIHVHVVRVKQLPIDPTLPTHVIVKDIKVSSSHDVLIRHIRTVNGILIS